MSGLQTIHDFLNEKHIAVAGVSRKSGKFGNTIFKELKKRGYQVYPVHPEMEQFEGEQCYSSLENLPPHVNSVVISTRPQVTRELIEAANKRGIRHVWLQQGAATPEMIAGLADNNQYITGKCIMMFAQPVNGIHAFHRFLNKLFGTYPKA